MTRSGYAVATTVTAGIVASLFAAAAVIAPRPRLLWNASASVPIGLYALHPVGTPMVGDLVAVTPPARLADWMARRHYLPVGVPLLKHIAVRAGQRVCRSGNAVRVDGRVIAMALRRDSHGRPLPVWQGCKTLGHGDIFLLNASVPDSLDGRYFGPLPAATVIGTATPLYTDEAGDGRFVWRAATR